MRSFALRRGWAWVPRGPLFRVLAATFGLTAGWAAHAPAEPRVGSEAAAQAVAVLPARLPTVLDPLAAGVGVWLRERLSAASFEVLPRAAVSSALAVQAASGAKGWDLAAVARALPGALVLDTEVRLSSGTVELRFALYDPREAKLIASHRASGPLVDLGSLLQDGIMGLFERLGGSTEALGQTPPPRLVDLAAYTRAVRALEHNDFARAWRSIEGRMLPPAVALRGRSTRHRGSLPRPRRSVLGC